MAGLQTSWWRRRRCENCCHPERSEGPGCEGGAMLDLRVTSPQVPRCPEDPRKRVVSRGDAEDAEVVSPRSPRLRVKHQLVPCHLDLLYRRSAGTAEDAYAGDDTSLVAALTALGGCGAGDG